LISSPTLYCYLDATVGEGKEQIQIKEPNEDNYDNGRQRKVW
jgi:hypothetical protein